MLPDLLNTTFLVDSGIADVVWNNGWRAGKISNMCIHGSADLAGPIVPLPQKAVVVCFIQHIKQVIANLNPSGKYILVCREGDQNLPLEIARQLPRCVKHVFSINVLEPNERVTAMPMAFHFGTGQSIQSTEALSIPRTDGKLVYAAFSIEGYRNQLTHERLSCVRHFADKDWATVPEQLKQGKWVTSPVEYPEYLKQLRSHKYLASPIGYGFERIAYWEAMLLGTIPICRRHPALLQFSDMPIAFVDDWHEVNPQWCESNLHLINRPIEKLKLSYWVGRINEAKSKM
jgi:hypothetical protein